MRAIFYGTPEIAVPSLVALTEVAEVVGVVSQPDRAAGRGQKLTPPPVKVRALDMGLSVYQPLKVKNGELESWVRERSPDVAIVIAYGRILPLGVLDAPRVGSLNLHASLLPRLRGSAPIQRAIIEGDEETGVCLMRMSEGMDEGAILSERRTPIFPEENAGDLFTRLGLLAASLLKEDLARAVSGEFVPKEQDSALATYAPPISPEECELDFERPAIELARRIRGLAPKPGAFSFLDGRRIRILAARAIDDPSPSVSPTGTLSIEGRAVLVQTGRGKLSLDLAQPEGKKALSAADLVNGRVLSAGARFSRSAR